MHDWTLLSLRIDWESGEVSIVVRGPKAEHEVRVSGALEIHVPRALPWGPSASINTVAGPTVIERGLSSLDIEMQSGDTIRIVARSFNMPDSIGNPA
jgi:hypothetical protein